MANVLGREKREQVLALGRLGWSLRRIQAETGVHRETASAYLKAAGIGIRGPGRWGDRPQRPAIETSTDSGLPPGRSPQASACEPYREWIEAGVCLLQRLYPPGQPVAHVGVLLAGIIAARGLGV